MRLAWFRPATHVSEQPDDTAALVGALGAEHEIALFDEAHAHDFIRLDFRAPFDLCVYEVADTRQHAFVWPYLLHVPGVLRLRSLSLHDSRTASLQRQHRERDRALAGSDNLMLAEHGTISPARQYSGRAVGADWRCPYSGRRGGGNVSIGQ
jgi:hypothetical protein